MIALGEMGAGNTLGRYELLLPVAQGGMAAVWAARMKGTRGFQKIVAIKTILPALSDDPQFEDMFLLEAQLASRIRHPNVCHILDLGEEDGTLYLVMEWIEGEALNAINRAVRPRGGMPIGVATRIGLAAAAGLHAAHETRGDDGELVGLVHRDVSPQNVLVTYDGVVKIVDFGVAKAAAAVDSRTKAGQLKGKVPFMSPEQALGKRVDRRSDVFSLGIILRQLIARKHPFLCENEPATLHRICEPTPVPPLTLMAPHCPDAICAAVDKALEKDPARRHPTMQDFARALERGLAALPPAVREEDVGAFVRATVGDRAAKRRASIQQATGLADARESQPRSSSGTFAAVVRGSSAEPSTPSGIAGPASAPSGMFSSGSMTDADSFVAEEFAHKLRGRRSRAALFVFGAAAVVAAGALVRQSWPGLLGTGSPQARAEQPPALAASAPIAAPSVPPEPVTTAHPVPAAPAPEAPPEATRIGDAPPAPAAATANEPVTKAPHTPVHAHTAAAKPAKPGRSTAGDQNGAFQFRDPGF